MLVFRTPTFITDSKVNECAAERVNENGLLAFDGTIRCQKKLTKIFGNNWHMNHPVVIDRSGILLCEKGHFCWCSLNLVNTTETN